jgi:dATP pyrophosphohydrolase
MRLPIQVQGILFRKINGKMQYLLLKRTPERGGFWQPVTGGLEEGETKIEALKREVREETGMKNIIGIIEDVHYFEFSDPHLFKEYVFGVEISSDEKMVLDRREHSQFRWCSFQEALRLLKWKENKEALTRLNEIVNHPK